MEATVFYPAELFDVAELDRVIGNTLTMTAKAVKVDLDTITRPFKRRPKMIIVQAKYYRLITAAENEAGKVFDILDAGSPRHPIRAKRAPHLSFYKTGFQAKTSPRRLYSGPGKKSTKDFRQPVEVDHPGFAPREFYETVGEKWDNELPVQMQRAIDSVVDKMGNQEVRVKV